MDDTTEVADAAERERRERILNTFLAISAGQSDVGRAFARRMRMHPTDATAIVEVIRAEDRGQPLTPARLSERVGLTSGATSILLTRLENAGHITRERENADRRLVTLRSATAVHQQGDEFFAPLREQLDKVMGDYTPEQLALIERFTNDFRRTIDEHGRAASAPS